MRKDCIFFSFILLYEECIIKHTLERVLQGNSDSHICPGVLHVLPVFQSTWGTWPLRSAWVGTSTCWVWTGSPAPGAAGWWRRCEASGTFLKDRTEGPLEEEEKKEEEKEEEEEQSHQTVYSTRCHSLGTVHTDFQQDVELIVRFFVFFYYLQST